MASADADKWDAIHAERGFFPAAPSHLVTAQQQYLPAAGGRALDVAGGTGRHAFWLGEHGFEPTVADISVAALDIARTEAASRGIGLETHLADLEHAPFPAGPWHVILSHHFLHRPLFADFAENLADGGVLVFVQPTRRNLERHPRPGARYLLDEHELPQLAAGSGLEVLYYDEGWSPDGRHEAVLVASRRTQSPRSANVSAAAANTSV